MSYFASHTKAKIKQYQMQLRNTKRGNSLMNEYLLKIKTAVDSLVSVGCPVSANNHTEVIFKGLSEEYLPFIISIISRLEPYKLAAGVWLHVWWLPVMNFSNLIFRHLPNSIAMVVWLCCRRVGERSDSSGNTSNGT